MAIQETTAGARVHSRVAALSDDELHDEIGAVAAHIDAATHELLAYIRRIEERRLYAQYEMRSTAAYLSWRTGTTTGTAREHVRVALALAELAHIDDALRRGIVSYSKVRAMTRVATTDNEERLLEMATNATAAQLEKICRATRRCGREDTDSVLPECEESERWLQFRPTEDGMVELVARLLPDEAGQVREALEDVRRKRLTELRAGGDVPAETSEALAEDPTTETGRPPENVPAETPSASSLTQAIQRRHDNNSHRKALMPTWADAMMTIVETYMAVGEPRSRKTADKQQLQVHLKPGLWTDDDYVAVLEDGTELSADSLRRIACDCSIKPLLSDHDGRTVDEGRKKRLVTEALRRSLIERDGTCCIFPGCNSRLELEGHHFLSWLDDGPTDRDNLGMVCRKHHRCVHEGGWSIESLPDGTYRFRNPEGRVVEGNPTRPGLAADAVERLMRTHREASLGITGKTNLQGYERRPDYDACVQALL